jgi:hypothetical protein
MNKGLERKLEQYSQPKQFECFWGDGYRDKDNKSLLAYHDQDFFNVLVGYDEKMISDIDDLRVNEKLNLNCITGEHWVRRIA